MNNSNHQLGGAMAWWVWTLAVIFVVFLFSFQTGYAIVNSSVQKDLSLTVPQVSTIAAIYTWAFAICQFFGGALLDRLGAHKVLPISIGLVTLGIFIFANANSFEMLLLSQVVVAIGSCTGFVGAGYVGGQWFGIAKFSFMFGLVQLMAALTSAFSQNLIGVAGAILGLGLGLGLCALIPHIDFGIPAEGRKDAPGVYVDKAKIAALGLRIRHGRSYHGLAFNVDLELEPFSRINPCGYAGQAVTRCRDLGIEAPLPEIRARLVEHLLGHLGYNAPILAPAEP